MHLTRFEHVFEYHLGQLVDGVQRRGHQCGLRATQGTHGSTTEHQFANALVLGTHLVVDRGG